MTYAVTTFYKFFDIEESSLKDLQQELLTKGAELDILGLILIAAEGMNATLAGSPDNLQLYKTFLAKKAGELYFKDSTSHKAPFRRLKVKIKPEIVALKEGGIRPQDKTSKHLSPDEWDRLLAEEDVVVIDVRNRYETKLGMFKKALDPKTWTFHQFPKFIRNSLIPKDKKVLMYCTGGIRCEKAALFMEKEGYKEVYQLDGGILNYIAQRPNKNYEGECFVFDHRVSVKQDLSPTEQYGLCPHCGNAGEQTLACTICPKTTWMCSDCETGGAPSTCSKNCKYQLEQKTSVTLDTP